MSVLHTIPGALSRATVIKRPSATIKSPYVADIQLDDGTVGLCHTPGLGCCGLVEANKKIYVCRSRPGSKTQYTAHIAECADESGAYYVGIHPMITQAAAQNLLHLISPIASWESEVTIEEHTRIDYVGTLPTGKRIYVEVKTAMASMKTNVDRSVRKAVFPEGYRKKIIDTVSPRAVKHAEVLAERMKMPDTEACVLLYIVPRMDCPAGLDINPGDPIYCAAVRNAVRQGVAARAFSLSYSVDGTICLGRELPVYVNLSQ